MTVLPPQNESRRARWQPVAPARERFVLTVFLIPAYFSSGFPLLLR
jgi:hypothetical protein